MKPATRNALIAGATAMLAGCLDANFTVVETATLGVDTTTSLYTGTMLVDFSSNGDFQKHKGGIDGISLDKVRIWFASINPGNAATQLTSSTLSFRADGAPLDGSQDVRVGIAVRLVLGDYLASSGKTFTMTIDNAQAVDKFLMDNVVKGSGSFYVVWNAQTDAAPAHATMQVELTTSLSYGML